MSSNFRVTFDIVTHESAEQSDVAESGFASPGGWHHDDPADLTLREAVEIVGRGSCENSGRWFRTVDACTDYRTGEETFYSVHPPAGITRSSYRRVQRILCGR